MGEIKLEENKKEIPLAETLYQKSKKVAEEKDRVQSEADIIFIKKEIEAVRKKKPEGMELSFDRSFARGTFAWLKEQKFRVEKEKTHTKISWNLSEKIPAPRRRQA